MCLRTDQVHRQKQENSYRRIKNKKAQKNNAWNIQQIKTIKRATDSD